MIPVFSRDEKITYFYKPGDRLLFQDEDTYSLTFVSEIEERFKSSFTSTYSFDFIIGIRI